MTTPSYPAASTVKGRVLGALLRGELLTHLDVWRRFGSSRLSGHIHALRGLGWRIKAMETTVRTSDAGRPATIAEYYLEHDAIGEAGDIGRAFAAECARIEDERRAA